jgi:hypothetical protein
VTYSGIPQKRRQKAKELALILAMIDREGYEEQSWHVAGADPDDRGDRRVGIWSAQEDYVTRVNRQIEEEVERELKLPVWLRSRPVFKPATKEEVAAFDAEREARHKASGEYGRPSLKRQLEELEWGQDRMAKEIRELKESK